MEFKALTLGKQVKVSALNANVHQMEVTLFIKKIINLNLRGLPNFRGFWPKYFSEIL